MKWAGLGGRRADEVTNQQTVLLMPQAVVLIWIQLFAAQASDHAEEGGENGLFKSGGMERYGPVPVARAGR